MKKITLLLLASIGFLPLRLEAADSGRENITFPRPDGTSPPFSNAVKVGNTLYISGAVAIDPATGKLGATTAEEATIVLDQIKKDVTAAGMTMDDLVWVQIFCTDLSLYAEFNKIYRSYFSGALPARAFLGAEHLLSGSHYEIMGIAIKK